MARPARAACIMLLVGLALPPLLLPPAAPAEAREVSARRASPPRNQVQQRQAVQRRLARQDAARRGVVIGGTAAAAMAAAAPADPPAPLQPAAWEDLPGWADDSPIEALPPVLASCRAFAAMTPGRALGGAGEIAAAAGTPELWRPACAALIRAWNTLPPLPPPNRRRGRAGQARLREAQVARNEHLRRALEENFSPAPVGEGLLTAYYEPVLRGSLAPDEAFATPLYSKPPEHVAIDVPNSLRPAHGRLQDGRLEPLPDRAAIQNGALAGRGLELAWVTDPAEAFFLHIQGSGRVVLPNGAVLRLGYAGQNGQPYRAVGRSLIERGELMRDRMSMRAIRAWMAAAGPERANALMAENPSYIFFQRNEGLRDDQGPPGAMGIPLTPERSVAVDPAVVPLGAPVFVADADPQPGRPAGERFRRLLAAQDTGGAIRGPGRGDLFRGWGHEAGERAGNVREPVRMWVLLPRSAAAMLAGRDP
ncbi:murein transglycosylase A [Roseomonas sp. BN140053]|uniref:murein transglycosylase A n=1 Tax=Roseomonas sp. BN140053 TaxID=3391898 RepID=UPI0039ED5218